MQYQSHLNSIKRGMIAPLYLIHGEEEYLQELIIKALKEALISPEIGAFNLDEIDGDKTSLSQLVQMANTMPVFAEKRLLIVKNPPFLKGKKQGEGEEKGGEDKVLLDYLADPLQSTCLVFWLKGNADKRKKLYKVLEKAGQVWELTPLKAQELTEWLKEEIKARGKTIEPSALDYLVAEGGQNLRQLQNELDKLALFLGQEKEITLAVVEQLLTKSSEASIFTLVDSLGQKKGEEALWELRNLLQQGEPPIRILFMIARQFRILLLAKELVQRGFSEKQLAGELNLHPFVVTKVLRQGKNFTFTELEDSLALILECDLAVKTGAPIQTALESLFLRLVSAYK